MKGHINTLYDDKSEKVSKSDIFIFFGVPVLIGTLIYLAGWEYPKEIYYTSTSVFGIFAGLLLNVQVALFNIHNRVWQVPEDEINKDLQNDKLDSRRLILKELNVTLSYLVLIASISIVASLIFYGLKANYEIFSSVEAVLYAHFLLTFLMASKRSYLLFAQEYEEDSVA